MTANPADGQLSVVIAPSRLKPMPAFCLAHGSFKLHGRKIGLALIRTKRPDFRPDAAKYRDKVLLRVLAFSCDYRERGIILGDAERADRNPDTGFTGVGAEFFAEVEAVGSAVTGLAIGDRVIPDSCYADAEARGLVPGLPTNRASSRFLIMHAGKLMRVPADMDPAIAASFTIGPQTSYGMVRRLDLKQGERVLVTAAHSNTSLFVFQALRAHGVDVFATASSSRRAREIRALGVKRLFVLPRGAPGPGWNALKAFCAKQGGFDGVVDPFSDLHLADAVECMRLGGRYISCGALHQHAAMKPVRQRPAGIPQVMGRALTNNLTIMGNCLGTTADLRAALGDHARGTFTARIDSTFRPAEMAAFFARSFDTADRFGKVVMRYE